MFVRFRKSHWRLKAYVAQTFRRDGKVVQEIVAYLGSIDTRCLGPAPDDERELIALQARVEFWEATNPKLKGLANRVGGGDEVKRLRMAVHARIPWPMQPERKRLEALKAIHEARWWHRHYEVNQKQIERTEKVIARFAAQNAEMRQAALKAINQANQWRAEAASILGAAKQAEG